MPEITFKAKSSSQKKNCKKGVAYVFRESEGRGHQKISWGLRPQTPSFASVTQISGSAPEFCKVNGVSSGISDINCGVPKGSCLGPLLFLIYVNDLPFSLEKAHVSMYADDTTISHSSKSLAALQHDLNCDLSNLQDWLHGNKLSLNVIKTQSLIIGSGPNIRRIQSQPDSQPSFEIDNDNIEIISSFKYLGVQVDNQLK